MPANRRLATVLVCLAALSSEECQGGEALVGKKLCDEGTCSISTTWSDTSAKSMNPEWLQAGPAHRDAQARRTRRVSFSHEDISGDESLRPFLATFRESLAKGAEDTVESVHVHAGRFSVGDALIAAENELEVTKNVVNFIDRRVYVLRVQYQEDIPLL